MLLNFGIFELDFQRLQNKIIQQTQLLANQEMQIFQLIKGSGKQLFIPNESNELLVYIHTPGNLKLVDRNRSQCRRLCSYGRGLLPPLFFWVHQKDCYN